MLTVDALAEELAVEPGDVAVLAHELDADASEQLADALASDLRLLLNPNGERTVLELYWPGLEDSSD